MPFLLLLFAFNLPEEIDKKISFSTEITNINKTIIQDINEKKNNILDEFSVSQDLKDEKLVLSLRSLINNFLILSSAYQEHIDTSVKMIMIYSFSKEMQDKEILEDLNNLLDLSINTHLDYNNIFAQLLDSFLSIEENLNKKKKDKLVRINSSLHYKL